jgi:hypothetical protein
LNHETTKLVVNGAFLQEELNAVNNYLFPFDAEQTGDGQIPGFRQKDRFESTKNRRLWRRPLIHSPMPCDVVKKTFSRIALSSNEQTISSDNM